MSNTCKFRHMRRCSKCGGDMFPSPIREDLSGQKYLIWRCVDCDFTERNNVNPDPEDKVH